jgi:hypothetical protein
MIKKIFSDEKLDKVINGFIQFEIIMMAFIALVPMSYM